MPDTTIWESNPIHAQYLLVVMVVALLPWMDYPYMQRIFHTFRGLHGSVNLKTAIKYLKSFTVQIVFRP